MFIDGAGGLPPFADSPDHQRLSAPNIARSKEPVHAGAIVAVVGYHICGVTPIDRNRWGIGEFRKSPRLHGAGKAESDECQIRLDDELRACYGPPSFVHLAALD